MSWNELRRCFRELTDALEADTPLDTPWQAFREVAQEAPPPHLALLQRIVDEQRGARAAVDFAILDHGCGGGLSALWLFARGFETVYGVDVGGRAEQLNRLFTYIRGIDEPRFWIYDGSHLPLSDESIDFVFSQQVLEHVVDGVFDSYYREEGRILRPGGSAYHQVPHRLVPYDTHTRTWLVHWFPRALRRPLYQLTGNDPDYVESILHLRSPRRHRAQTLAHIGTCEDRTVQRLAGLTDLEGYDGSVALRRLIGGLARLPVLGHLAGWVLRNFVMLDTVSVKLARTP